MGSHFERVLSTSDLKLAAVLLLFGLKLKQHQPFDWTEEFETKEQYFQSRENYRVKGTPKVTWNFEPGGADAHAIFKAFNNENAEAELDSVLEQLPDSKEIRVKHSAVITRAAREVLEHLEFLITLKGKIPPNGKWVVVRNAKGQCAKFGKNASLETIEEVLSRI
jgi:hypothetical protein